MAGMFSPHARLPPHLPSIDPALDGGVRINTGKMLATSFLVDPHIYTLAHEAS